jgi:DNA mismatch repair protein MutS
VPGTVNERAKQVLAHLEAEHLDEAGRPKMSSSGKKKRQGDLQLTLFAAYDHPLLATIREVDVDQLSPLAALQLVSEWRKALRAEQQ